MRVNLRKLRIESGLTIEQLSKRAHVGMGTISRIERNEIVPKITTICKLCSALGVGIEKLIECRRYCDGDKW